MEKFCFKEPVTCMTRLMNNISKQGKSIKWLWGFENCFRHLCPLFTGGKKNKQNSSISHCHMHTVVLNIFKILVFLNSTHSSTLNKSLQWAYKCDHILTLCTLHSSSYMLGSYPGSWILSTGGLAAVILQFLVPLSHPFCPLIRLFCARWPS